MEYKKIKFATLAKITVTDILAVFAFVGFFEKKIIAILPKNIEIGFWFYFATVILMIPLTYILIFMYENILLFIKKIPAYCMKIFSRCLHNSYKHRLTKFHNITNLLKIELDKTKQDLENITSNHDFLLDAIQTVGEEYMTKNKISVKKIEYEYHLEKDWDARVNKIITIEATSFISCIENRLWVDDNANQVNRYAEIQKTTDVLGDNNIGRTISVIPSLVSSRKRGFDFILLFSPILKPKEKIQFSISYRWPGYFNTLKTKKVDTITWDTRKINEENQIIPSSYTFDEVDVDIKIFIPKSMIATLKSPKNIKDKSPKEKVHATDNKEKNEHIVQYKVKKADRNNKKLELKISY